TINALPIVSLGADTFLCVGAGATITLDAGNLGSTYLWNEVAGGQTMSVTAAGEYRVQVTDGNFCQAKDTIQVDSKTATVFDLGTDQTICPGGDAKIAVPTTPASILTTGSYVWEDGTSVNPYVVTSGKADGYTEKIKLTYTNEFNCVSADSLTVTVDNVLLVTGLDDKPLCVGQSYSEFDTDFKDQANSGDYSYLWNDVSASTGTNFPINNVTMAQNGLKILVTVTDNVQGCTGKDSAILSVNPLPVPLLRDTATCLETAVTINSQLTTPTHTFSWTKNNSVIANSSAATHTIDGLIAGVDTYKVIATIATTGCQDSVTVTVSTLAGPVASLGGDSGVACIGEQKVLNATTGASYQYIWTMNSSVLAETSSSLIVTVDGAYQLTVVDNLTSCSDAVSTIVTFYAPPIVDLKVDSFISLCAGSDTVITYQDFDVSKKYVWSNGATNTDKMTITEFGVYWLKETVGGCVDIDTIVVVHRELPTSGLPGDTVICFEDMLSGSMLLDSKQMNNIYLWNTGDTTQSIAISKSGYYEVNITSEYGCKITDGVLIQEDCMANIWLPAAFTPNGDGINDTWIIGGRGIKTVNVQVYNRWGEKIWEGQSIADFWDGRVRNNPVAEDVYVWRVNYTYGSSDGTEQSRTQVGHLTIFR
ncbi:MAG: gliding motility-associated-like protein, partial [Saprospiraceae bacterium]